jgi:hypothetical protein
MPGPEGGLLARGRGGLWEGDMKIRRACSRLFAVAVSAWALAWPAAGALARGAMGYEQNVCVLKVGPDFMYFTGYQPAAAKNKFCEDIPSVGETIFVFDYAQDEMREMKTDFRIVRDVGEAEEPGSLDAITVAYLPPKIYPTGTLNFQHAFNETGNFVGIVTVDGPNGEHWAARFPFAVGGGYSSRTPYYFLTAAAVLALLWLFWGKSEPPRKPIARG